jgi:N-acetyl-anhydromuramyl-L-alanine amidase AmpD
MAYETEIWPFVQAKHFKAVAPGRIVRLGIVHDMEFPEKLTAAEDVARYFATTDTVASAHTCVDSDSVVQCVKDNDVAFAAPGCNHDGWQLELAGFGKQTKREWWDKYSLAMLAIGADVMAQICMKYNLPPVHLTNTQLERGEKGIIGHYQATQVYRKSDHTDPGVNFPWQHFISMVQNSIAYRRTW